MERAQGKLTSCAGYTGRARGTPHTVCCGSRQYKCISMLVSGIRPLIKLRGACLAGQGSVTHWHPQPSSTLSGLFMGTYLVLRRFAHTRLPASLAVLGTLIVLTG